MQPKCLIAANESQHSEIVKRTKAAIRELVEAGKRITFYNVAEKAQVSRSTLYRCDDLRILVEEARAKTAPRDASNNTLETRVAELEQELAKVTFERDLLRCLTISVPVLQYASVRVGVTA